MKIRFHKIILFLTIILFKHTIQIQFKFSNNQQPFADDQYRQANVPPIVTTIFDVPEYGNTELFKWSDYIQANTLLVSKNKKFNQEKRDKVYFDRLNRLGKLKAKIIS